MWASPIFDFLFCVQREGQAGEALQTNVVLEIQNRPMDV